MGGHRREKPRSGCSLAVRLPPCTAAPPPPPSSFFGQSPFRLPPGLHAHLPGVPSHMHAPRLSPPLRPNPLHLRVAALPAGRFRPTPRPVASRSCALPVLASLPGNDRPALAPPLAQSGTQSVHGARLTPGPR